MKHGRRPAVAMLLGACILTGSHTSAQPAEPEPQAVLHVGVVDGAQPCSNEQNGQWQGLAVDLWTQLASAERLPFVLESRPSAAALLRDVQRGTLDAGVGCLTITPERVNRIRFSLPFQEMGLAVLQRLNRLETGEAVLRSLLNRDLMQLLAAYLAATALVSGLLWRSENHGESDEGRRHGRRRTFARIFQILATGPGTNTIAVTTRAHALVIVSYLIRIVTASLLVTTITINVVREPSFSGNDLRRLSDLQGQRVAARPGSVSEEMLQAINAAGTKPPIRIVPLPQVIQAPAMLLEGTADAVLAEDQQLQYALQSSPKRGLVISLRGLQQESQAFALSPRLDNGIAAQINRGISRLKRSGVVRDLQRSAMNKS